MAPTNGFAAFVEGLQKSGGSEKLLSILQQQQAQAQQKELLKAQAVGNSAQRKADGNRKLAASLTKTHPELATFYSQQADELDALVPGLIDDPAGTSAKITSVMQRAPMKAATGTPLTGDAMTSAVTQAAEAGKPMNVGFGQTVVTPDYKPESPYSSGEVTKLAAEGDAAAALEAERAKLDLNSEYKGREVMAGLISDLAQGADPADRDALIALLPKVFKGESVTIPTVKKPVTPDQVRGLQTYYGNLENTYRNSAVTARNQGRTDDATDLEALADAAKGIATATDPAKVISLANDFTGGKITRADGTPLKNANGTELVAGVAKGTEDEADLKGAYDRLQNRAGNVAPDSEQADYATIAANTTFAEFKAMTPAERLTLSQNLNPPLDKLGVAGAFDAVKDELPRAEAAERRLRANPNADKAALAAATEYVKQLKAIRGDLWKGGQPAKTAVETYKTLTTTGVTVEGAESPFTLSQIEGVTEGTKAPLNTDAYDYQSLMDIANSDEYSDEDRARARKSADLVKAAKPIPEADRSPYKKVTKPLETGPQDYARLMQIADSDEYGADDRARALRNATAVKNNQPIPEGDNKPFVKVDNSVLNYYKDVAAAVNANPDAPEAAKNAADAIIKLAPGSTVTDEQKKALRWTKPVSFAAASGEVTASLTAAQNAVVDLTDEKLTRTPAQEGALAAARQYITTVRDANTLARNGKDAEALAKYETVANGVTINGTKYTIEDIASAARGGQRAVEQTLATEGRTQALADSVTADDIAFLKGIARGEGNYNDTQRATARTLAGKMVTGYKPTESEWAQLRPLLYTTDTVIRAYDAGSYGTASAALAYLEKNDAAGFANIPDAVKQGVKAGLEDEKATKAAEARLRDLNLDNASFQNETQGLAALGDLATTRDLGTLSRLKNDPVYRSKWKVSLTQVTEAIGRATRDGKNDVLAKALQFSAAGVSGLAGLDGLAEEAKKYGINLNPYRDIARDESAGAVLQAAAELSDMGSRGLKVLNSATFQARAKRAGVDLSDWVATAQNSANEEARAKNDTEYGKGLTYRNNLVEEFVNGRSWESIKSDPNFARVVKTVYGNKAVDFYNYAAGLKKAADAKKALDKQIADLTIKEKVANIANDAARLSLERQRIAQAIADGARAQADRDRQYKLDERRVRLAEKSGDVKEVAAARAAAAKPLLASKSSISTEIRTLRTNVANLFGDRALTDILADDSVKEDVKTLARSYQTRITAAEGELANVNLNLDSIYGYPAGTTAGVVAPSTGNAGGGNSGGNTTTTTTTTTPPPNAGASGGISKSGSNWLVAGVTVTPAGATFINQKLSQWSSLTPGERDGMVASVASYLKVNNDTAKRVLNTIAQNGGLE
jgi:hypothetical protein